MGASITFRLKSSNHVGTIDMEGSVIPCHEVQEAIAAKLCAPAEEIHIFLSGSTALLHPDEDLPAYAVVDVVRQTASGRGAGVRPRSYTATSSAAGAATSMSRGRGGRGGAAGFPASRGGRGASPATPPPPPVVDGTTPLTEEERLAQLQAEVSLDTGIDEVGGRFRRGGRGGRGDGGAYFGGADRGRQYWNEENFRPPPPGYICHNCGKGGHLIQHCPSARGGKGVKVISLPVGIPESMLEECTMDDPAPKFITRDHRIVKRRIDSAAFVAVQGIALGASSTPASPDVAPVGAPHTSEGQRGEAVVGATPFVATSRAEATSGGDEAQLARYKCVVDHVLATEAMKTPCCGSLLCKRCFTKIVDEALGKDDAFGADEGLLCPGCREPLIMDDVVAATEERVAIAQLLPATHKRPREELH